MVISKENIKYSLKNLSHRRGRSLLTIFSIFIGITTIFIFISFGLGLYTYIDGFASSTSADKITVQPKGVGTVGTDDTFFLTEDDLKAVERTIGVYEATGITFKAAEVEKDDIKKFVYLVAYDPKIPLMIELSDVEIVQGRELQNNDKGKVVLGYNYMFDDKIFSKGLSLNEKILVQGKDYRVVGFYSAVGNPTDDSNVYVINDAVEDLYPEAEGHSWIIARADTENLTKVVNDISNSVRKSRDVEKGKEDFFVASFEDLLESYTSSLYIVIFFIVAIALVSVVVSAINTANTMITSVLERIKEIGVIKAVGAKNSEIFKIFLFESGFLGLVAGILGVLLGWGITSAAGNLLTNLGWGFLQPLHNPWLFIGCILFATITGALSGVIPAYQASKTNIVESLRYE